MFDIKYDIIKETNSKPKKADLDYMNDVGLKSISYSRQIIDMVLTKEEKFDYA